MDTPDQPSKHHQPGVCVSSDIGGRPSMEDVNLIIHEQDQSFFAVFDGHGGSEAALYARDNIWNFIKEQPRFLPNASREDIVDSIQMGFLKTQEEMRKQLESWPKHATGEPSTSGSTAVVCLMRGSLLYVAHVGDSRAVLCKSEPFLAYALTIDHKPSLEAERNRIEKSGGSISVKNNCHRVEWKRIKTPPSTPSPKKRTLRSAQNQNCETVPYLAMSRALGNFWSFNETTSQYVVSPLPDVKIIEIETNDLFLILASDGLWNVMGDSDACSFAFKTIMGSGDDTPSKSPSKKRGQSFCVSEQLVYEAVHRWKRAKRTPDNTTVMFVPLSRHCSRCRSPSPSGNVVAESITEENNLIQKDGKTKIKGEGKAFLKRDTSFTICITPEKVHVIEKIK
eukprot:TRINITY_DN18333_c0_g1_i1.p1 TRINITY_DN18333_c0_g1~~TRINITY_DN18333_c0_g1_i1.p1  ORF type:complete len:395 (+),score=54.29 TRINITY_DN18333_c0_g1_i1:3-1187(+)